MERLRFPYILAKIRSEEGKKIRRQYKNDIGVPYQLVKSYTLKLNRICDTITTFTTDNNVIDINMETTTKLPAYKPNPTKEELIEYFGKRVKVRKLTPTEAFRLMDVDDKDIDKIHKATKEKVLRNGSVLTIPAISKTAKFKLAGNSIVVNCLYHIFRTLLLQNQPENQVEQVIQPSLFD